jgi:hypothetical protein
MLDSVCLTPFSALDYLPDVPLTDSGYAKVMHGKSPEWPETMLLNPPDTESKGLVRLSRNGTLAAVAQLLPTVDGCSRLILKRVFT